MYNYESPVSIQRFVEQAVQEKHEAETKTICTMITEKIHVEVDKERLLKALQFDREQYHTGYHDGYRMGLMAGEQNALNRMRMFVKEEVSDGQDMD